MAKMVNLMLCVLYHNKKITAVNGTNVSPSSPSFLIPHSYSFSSNNIPCLPQVPPTHHLPLACTSLHALIPAGLWLKWTTLGSATECDLLYRISLAFYRAENQEACLALNLARSPISWSKPFSSLDLLSIKIGRWPSDPLRSFSSESLKVPWLNWQETEENIEAC